MLRSDSWPVELEHVFGLGVVRVCRNSFCHLEIMHKASCDLPRSECSPLVSEKRVWVVTNEQYRAQVLEHVPYAEVYGEPVARNTAAPIGLAAAALAAENPDAVMIVLPADHAVTDEPGLRDALSQACKAAASDEVLVTIGIAPESAHTGYGYIEKGEVCNGAVCKVKRFVEKAGRCHSERLCSVGELLLE